MKLLLLLLFSISVRFHFFQKHSFKYTHLLNFLGRTNREGGQTLKTNSILRCIHLAVKSLNRKASQATEIMCF